MITNNKEKMVRVRGKEFHCDMDVAMDFIGGKWKDCCTLVPSGKQEAIQRIETVHFRDNRKDAQPAAQETSAGWNREARGSMLKPRPALNIPLHNSAKRSILCLKGWRNGGGTWQENEGTSFKVKHKRKKRPNTHKVDKQS